MSDQFLCGLIFGVACAAGFVVMVVVMFCDCEDFPHSGAL